MANSETRKKAISLGKKLLVELSPEAEADTLTRWMAHYVSEQIIAAENTVGAEKAAAEERCFNTVLALWEHRSKLPNGHRPLEEFEPILRALARLDPDSPRPFYLPQRRQSKKGQEEAPDDVDKLIETVLLIDRAARMLINQGLKSAARRASTESTKAFLDEALANERAGDIEAIRLLVVSSERDRGDALRSAAIKRLESDVTTLDQLCSIIRAVRPGFVSQLKKLRKTRPKRKTKSTAC